MGNEQQIPAKASLSVEEVDSKTARAGSRIEGHEVNGIKEDASPSNSVESVKVYIDSSNTCFISVQKQSLFLISNEISSMFFICYNCPKLILLSIHICCSGFGCFCVGELT